MFETNEIKIMKIKLDIWSVSQSNWLSNLVINTKACICNKTHVEFFLHLVDNKQETNSTLNSIFPIAWTQINPPKTNQNKSKKYSKKFLPFASWIRTLTALLDCAIMIFVEIYVSITNRTLDRVCWY